MISLAYCRRNVLVIYQILVNLSGTKSACPGLLLAKTLENIFHRAGDQLARYGGDEFVIILPNTDKETGLKMAHTLNDEIIKLKIQHSDSKASPYVTLSIGVVTMENSGMTLSATDLSEKNLIESADQALYLTKHN